MRAPAAKSTSQEAAAARIASARRVTVTWAATADRERRNATATTIVTTRGIVGVRRRMCAALRDATTTADHRHTVDILETTTVATITIIVAHLAEPTMRDTAALCRLHAERTRKTNFQTTLTTSPLRKIPLRLGKLIFDCCMLFL